MGILKKLFGKKEEEPEEEIQEEVEEEEQLPRCAECGMKIEKELHGIKTHAGKKFHKKCFRKIKKQANKMAFK